MDTYFAGSEVVSLMGTDHIRVFAYHRMLEAFITFECRCRLLVGIAIDPECAALDEISKPPRQKAEGGHLHDQRY